MNRKLLAAAVAGVVAPMTAQALDIGVSGHVNRIVRFADNGSGSDVQHLDHIASRSRFRFTAEGEVMPGITAGARIESGFASSRGFANDVDMPDSGPGAHAHDLTADNMDDEQESGEAGAATGDFRFSELYFSGGFGKVTLGHVARAGNGQMWQSHNGAWAGTEFGVDSNSGTSVTIEYQSTSDAADNDGQNIGLGVNQSLGSGVDVYAGFNNYTFDDATDRDLEDVNSFHIGSRVRFD